MSRDPLSEIYNEAVHWESSVNDSAHAKDQGYRRLAWEQLEELKDQATAIDPDSPVVQLIGEKMTKVARRA